MPVQIGTIRISNVPSLNSELGFKVRPGYNSVYGNNGSGKSAAVVLLSSVLEADRFQQLAEGFTRQGKVRLDLKTDQTQIAIQRDLATFALAVKLRERQSSPTRIQGETELQNAVMEHLEFCVAADWRAVFVWQANAHQFMNRGRDASANQEFSDMDDKEIRIRLQELQEERMMMGSMGNVQEQADEIQNRLFEIEHRLEEVNKILSLISSLQNEVDDKQPVLDGGRALAERARNYETAQTRFDKIEYKHFEKRQTLEKSYQRAEQQKVWFQDPKLYATIAVFVISIITASVLKNQLIALPSLAALGYAGFLTWQYIQAMAAKSSSKEALDDEIRSHKTAKKKHDDAVSLILQLQTQYKLLSPSDLANTYTEALEKRKQLATITQEHNQTALAEELQNLQQEEISLNDKLGKLSGALQEAAGGHSDIRLVDEQIRKLEASLHNEDLNDAEHQDLPANTNTQLPLGDYQKLVQAAVRVARIADFDSLAARIAENLNKYVTKFRPSWSKVLVTENELTIQNLKGDRVVATELEPRDQLLLAGLFRIFLWLSFPQERLHPAILDDPFADLDDDDCSLLAKLLLQCAKSQQILHFTSRRIFAPTSSSFSMQDTTASSF